MLIYVDPWVETSLEPSDPSWVGAWWIFFICFGVLSWLLAIPFLMFPKVLPDSSLKKQERAKEMAQEYKGQDSINEVDLGTKLKTFPQHLKLVLKTPSWVFITIGICFSNLVLVGVGAFAPKYLESQFSLDASTANLFTGLLGTSIQLGYLTGISLLTSDNISCLSHERWEDYICISAVYILL